MSFADFLDSPRRITAIDGLHATRDDAAYFSYIELRHLISGAQVI